MKNLKYLLLGLTCIYGLGCSPALKYYSAFYDMEFSIETTDKKERGVVKSEKVEFTENDHHEFKFEDGNIDIIWIPDEDNFSFELKNKSDSTIKIIWDDSLIITPDNENHRIIHNGVKFNDRDKAMVSTPVIRKGIHRDSIQPSDYIYFKSGRNYESGWDSELLFSKSVVYIIDDNAVKMTEKLKSNYEGKKFQILLPLEIKDSKKEYIFTFTINDTGLRPMQKK